MGALEQLNETTDPAAADYVWLADMSVASNDRDRKVAWTHIADSGVWTPELQIGGATTGITYSARSGYYAKIGDKIGLMWFDFSLSSKGSLTGNIRISSVPFIPGQTAPLTFAYWNNTNLGTVTPSGRLDGGQTLIVFTKALNGRAEEMLDTDLTNTSRFIGQLICYL